MILKKNHVILEELDRQNLLVCLHLETSSDFLLMFVLDVKVRLVAETAPRELLNEVGNLQ